MYNGLYTSMLMEQEWQSFAHRRKQLRVSLPVEGQRATYFLTLPYRYSVPLMVVCGLMHWLISQSIFLAHVLVYDTNGERLPRKDVLTCGYSPIGIIFSIVGGGIMLVALVANGLRRFKPGLPMAKSRSEVVAESCKRLPWDTRASTSWIQWGALGGQDGVNRYVFTSYGVVSGYRGTLE